MDINITQGKIAIIDDEDYDKIKDRSWQFSNGYAVSGSNSPSRHLRMHRVVLGLTRYDKIQIDHINGNRLDNRKSNLRICNCSQNQANKEKISSNTSGYKGVTFHKAKNKWMASAKYMGKSYFAGYFSNPIDAAKAYDALVKKLRGEYSRTNFNE